MEYRDYLRFLSDLHQELEHLIQIGQQKIDAVRSHDLDELNTCIRQEQAISLSLRGMDQKRQKILSALGMEQVPLRKLADCCPKEFQAETACLIEKILRDNHIIESIQTPVRSVLEQELRLIQSELEARGVEQDRNPNYQSTPAARPAELRTDIRV